MRYWFYTCLHKDKHKYTEILVTQNSGNEILLYKRLKPSVVYFIDELVHRLSFTKCSNWLGGPVSL